jgi:hypothetical protein
MTMGIFESVGLERGVLALESPSLNDWGGLIVGSFDTTNTPDFDWELQPRLTLLRDIDATLCEAFDQYDDLLRRLAD